MLNLNRFALVDERVLRAILAIRTLSTVCDDVLGDAITEIFLFRIAAHFVEWQDRNCWFLSIG